MVTYGEQRPTPPESDQSLNRGRSSGWGRQRGALMTSGVREQGGSTLCPEPC